MASPVLVTGGTGRLGKLVVARLQDSGCDVRVLARHDRNGALLPPPGHTVGSRTWDQFLTTQLRQQATTTA
jgi:uncharacterized protein YbjT (DUF2867 family)